LSFSFFSPLATHVVNDAASLPGTTSVVVTGTDLITELTYNVNFTVALAVPTTAPSTPPHAESDVISIYSDSYTNISGVDYNPSWGQSTTVTVDYDVAGNNTLKYENLNYQGTDWSSNHQDVSEYDFLHVDFWTPNSTDLGIFLISPGRAEVEYLLVPPGSTESWVSVDIPLTAFAGVNLADVFQFKVDGNGTVYFDNLYFWTDPPVVVNLSSFYALYTGSTPSIYWVTQSEEDNEYWNIYRGNSDNFMEASQLNENNPIPGNGTTNMVSDYVYVDTTPVTQNTTYWYWIEDVSIDGETEVHQPISLSIPLEDSPNVPVSYGLHQNYPNPFNPSTSISFTLEEDRDVELIIFNVKGEQIRKYDIPSHQNTIIWDGTDQKGDQVSSGVYFYKLITDTKEYQKKMLLVK